MNAKEIISVAVKDILRFHDFDWRGKTCNCGWKMSATRNGPKSGMISNELYLAHLAEVIAEKLTERSTWKPEVEYSLV